MRDRSGILRVARAWRVQEGVQGGAVMWFDPRSERPWVETNVQPPEQPDGTSEGRGGVPHGGGDAEGTQDDPYIQLGLPWSEGPGEAPSSHPFRGDDDG